MKKVEAVVIIHSTYPVHANKKQYAQEIMVHMTNAALRSEECISYEFFFSLDQAEKILLIQEWHSIEAAEKYYNTPTMQLLANELPLVLSGEVETKAYTKNAQNTEHTPTDCLSDQAFEGSDHNRTIH
ncbi:MAG: antibiotic biosynthesis monooxygenase [Pseudomonadales bacterium]|nr:antibiotic biosynthesis monooxygenase [Pseudomonadales bacterium]